ncbi:hypothetical protein D1AOALGA4SA_3876 [Olavius algarvensis Delta 1 endosymbiont]|nr:hypothetical protein D1AOALGA4SA_3876 [Olavius algarvensis Delta 1 endosymbiont]
MAALQEKPKMTNNANPMIHFLIKKPFQKQILVLIQRSLPLFRLHQVYLQLIEKL